MNRLFMTKNLAVPLDALFVKGRHAEAFEPMLRQLNCPFLGSGKTVDKNWKTRYA